MPSKDEKKLIQLGSALALSVPKSWENFWDLHKGDSVTAYWNSVLVIVPSGCEESEELKQKVRRFLGAESKKTE